MCGRGTGCYKSHERSPHSPVHLLGVTEYGEVLVLRICLGGFSWSIRSIYRCRFPSYTEVAESMTIGIYFRTLLLHTHYENGAVDRLIKDILSG